MERRRQIYTARYERIKKLSDFFIDEKIDIFSKNNQWLLLDGSRIIWVCGRRVSDHVKITSNTTKYGKLIFRK